MITTTVLIAMQFKYVKGLPAWMGLLFFLTFGFFDGMWRERYRCRYVRLTCRHRT